MSINSLLTNTPILNAIAASTQEIISSQTRFGQTIKNTGATLALTASYQPIGTALAFSDVPAGSSFLVSYSCMVDVQGDALTNGYVKSSLIATGATCGGSATSPTSNGYQIVVTSSTTPPTLTTPGSAFQLGGSFIFESVAGGAVSFQVQAFTAATSSLDINIIYTQYPVTINAVLLL